MCNTSLLVVFGHWAPSPGNIVALISEFKPVLEDARQNTEEILCYYLLREKKEDDTVSVVTVACFRSEEAYTKHRQSLLMHTLAKACEQNSLLSTAQYDQVLESAAGFPFRDRRTANLSGLHTMMAKINYFPGTRTEGITHWDTVGKAVEVTEEEGTFCYWFLADKEDVNILWSLEMYKDEEYLWDVHVPSKAIQSNIATQKEIRSGLGMRVFETIGF